LLSFGGVLDVALRHVEQIKFQCRIDFEVVGFLGLFNSQGLALELLFELARRLGRDLPSARASRPLVALD